MPSTFLGLVPRTMWQIEVPMIMSILPGLVIVAAGTATWASTLATATGVPAFRPRDLAIRGVRPPAQSPWG